MIAGTAGVPPAQSFKIALNLFSRFALICGRDARGPNNHLMLRNPDSASEGIKVPNGEINNNSQGNGGSGNNQPDLCTLT